MGMIDLLRVLVIIGMISCEDKGGVRLVLRVGEDVVLPCSLGPEVDIEPTLFDWTKDRQDVFLYNAGIYYSENPQFKGRVSHFPDELRKGNASITIRNIQRPDSGNYSCFFPHLQQQRFNVELLVGTSTKPRVMILNSTEDQALLQCEICGAFPKPQISWLDSGGIVLPAEEKMEDSDGLQNPPALMLQTTITKSGIFSCRVAQKELNHINEAHISAHISSDKTARRFDEFHLILVCLIVVLTVLHLMMVWRMCKTRVLKERLQAMLKAERSAVEGHLAMLETERSTWEMFDSGVSFPRPSDDLKRLKAMLETEPFPWAESCDIDKSSLRSSDSLPRLQEIEEPKLKAAPDETSEMILKEMEIM